MRIEKLRPVIRVHIVNMNHTQSERNVNNDKNEQKDQNVQDHVGHANDNRSSLPPH